MCNITRITRLATSLRSPYPQTGACISRCPSLKVLAYIYTLISRFLTPSPSSVSLDPLMSRPGHCPTSPDLNSQDVGPVGPVPLHIVLILQTCILPFSHVPEKQCFFFSCFFYDPWEKAILAWTCFIELACCLWALVTVILLITAFPSC